METSGAIGSLACMARRENPDVPDDLREAWEELLRITDERERAADELERTSKRARELVVELLRGGVRRQDLVDRPFSSAGLTKIQEAEGLRTRPPRT